MKKRTMKKRTTRSVRKHAFGSDYNDNSVSTQFFGYQEPFIKAPEFWYPVANGAYQSPEMLQKWDSTSVPLVVDSNAGASAFGRHKRRVNRRTSRKTNRFGAKRKSSGCGCGY